MSRASTLAKAIGADGAIAVSGNTTLGDASTDTVTFNAATASIPNNLNFSGGKVGIGVAPTATWESARKAFQIGSALALDCNSTSQAVLRANSYYDGTDNRYINGAPSTAYEQTGGSHRWYTVGTGTAGNAFTYSQIGMFDTAGNFAVGNVPTSSMRVPSFQVGSSGVFRSEHYATNNTQVKVTANAYEHTDTSYKRIYAEPSSMYRQSGGNHYWMSGPTGTAGEDAALANTMTLDAAGNLSPYGNLVVASGKGIDFSVTANGSGSVGTEVLDDYEAGTWTPQIGGANGGTKTSDGQNGGWYRKVGNLVVCGGTLSWNSADALSGNILIKNLPFACAAGTGARGGGVPGVVSFGLSPTSGYTGYQIVVDPTATAAYLIQTNATAYSHTPTVGTSGTVYGFTFSYLAS